MNCRQIEQLWEARRDGELSADESQAFDAHLRQCERCAAVWRAETVWLDAVADTELTFAGQTTTMDSAAFAESVVEQWQGRGAVAGRIGPWSWLRWAGAVAAAIAIVVTVAIVSRPPPSGAPGPGPIAGGKAPAVDKTPNPVTALMASTNGTYQAAVTQPLRIRQTISKTASLLDVSNLVDLLDPGVPDPGEFVEPAGHVDKPS